MLSLSKIFAVVSVAAGAILPYSTPLAKCGLQQQSVWNQVDSVTLWLMVLLRTSDQSHRLAWTCPFYSAPVSHVWICLFQSLHLSLCQNWKLNFLGNDQPNRLKVNYTENVLWKCSSGSWIDDQFTMQIYELEESVCVGWERQASFFCLIPLQHFNFSDTFTNSTTFYEHKTVCLCVCLCGFKMREYV